MLLFLIRKSFMWPWFCRRGSWKVCEFYVSWNEQHALKHLIARTFTADYKSECINIFSQKLKYAAFAISRWWIIKIFLTHSVQIAIHLPRSLLKAFREYWHDPTHVIEYDKCIHAWLLVLQQSCLYRTALT